VWNVREQLATVGAFLDVYVSNPTPVSGDPEPLCGLIPSFLR